MPDRPDTLMVPIHLDALYLRADRSVVEPMADFSRLPYAAADHDVNADVAYLSEELLSQPFHDCGFQLKAGIHLHWALPDALHKGSGHGLLFSVPVDGEWVRQLDSSELPGGFKDAFALHANGLSAHVTVIGADKPGRWVIEDRDSGRRYNVRLAGRWHLDEPAGGTNPTMRAERRLNVYGSEVTFPAVPDRWLITRRGGGTATRQWIIESDYLHPPDSTPAQPLVTYPYSDESSSKPFRYLGRCLTRERWQIDRDAAATRLAKVTAVGYGEPNFAAFYPNCHSVFGFHDDEFADTPPHLVDDLTYDVVGWYSRPQQDCLRSPALHDIVDGLMTRYGLDQATADTLTDDARQHFIDVSHEAIASQLAWKVADEHPAAIPERTVCHARVMVACKAFDFSDPARHNEIHHQVDVAIGNTGTEALSAYLAHRLRSDKWTKWQIEDQLEAVHLGTLTDVHHLDIGAKFREARHAREFTAVAGGMHWSVVAAEIRRTADGRTVPPAQLTPQIDDLVAALNRLQATFECGERDLASLRKQLFADWCRYQVRAYPAVGDPLDTEPYDHQIQAFIVEHDLKPIEQLTAQLETQAQTLRTELAELLQAVDGFNQQHPDAANYEVKSSPAPQFWQPNEPVLLIAGDSALSTPRHGTDGLLDCDLVSLPDGPLEDHLDALVASAQGLADDQDPQHHRCCEQPWHPFLLEWSVDIHHLARESNANHASRQYQPSFIDSNYDFAAGHVDLFLRAPQRDTFASAANSVSGRTILTAYASSQLRIQLETLLRQQLLPAYYEALAIPPEQRSDADTDALFKQLRDWYRAADASHHDGVTDALFDAYDTFYDERGEPRIPCLTQSLGGFNEALLMRKQTLQLPIADPLGFADDRAFAERVRLGVGNMNRSAPQPNNHFMPIRAGLLRLARLRLVDTFGRVQNLDFDHARVVTTEAMAVGKIPDLIQLRPRLSQPARLNLRWLAAASDAVASYAENEASRQGGTSPVCGWLLPNHLDQSLMVFAANGEALGSIEDVSGKAVWRGAPGEHRMSPWQLPNPHLCRLVCHLMSQDMAGFLARLETQLAHIDPQWFAQHEALSVLMGRPLAIVRARLGLELRGLPALNQHDIAFVQDVHKGAAARRTHDAFTAVRFPVRLGDAGQLNDGLAAYWREQRDAHGGCCLDGNAYFSDDAAALELALDDDPQTFTLLLDPRGVLHATSGILPTKVISIPHEHYTGVLKRLNVTFHVGPVLTSRAALRLPLPNEPGHAWSWLEHVDGEWDTIDTIRPPQTDARWDETTEILEGWLKLTERDTE